MNPLYSYKIYLLQTDGSMACGRLVLLSTYEAASARRALALYLADTLPTEEKTYLVVSDEDSSGPWYATPKIERVMSTYYTVGGEAL